MVTEILLYISLGWLVITSVVLLRNYVRFTRLKNVDCSVEKAPFVSICIPARNEEPVIEHCVRSILEQNYTHFEVIVLNDQSEDRTLDILKTVAHDKPELIIIEGFPKPDDWLGKPWACHQLSQRANGDIIIFIDADTWWNPDALEQITKAFTSHKLDALTVWPQQHFGSFWEKALIPMIYHALCTLLPTEFVHTEPVKQPRWLQKKWRTSFAAACGQCIAFTRECYAAIGGHSCVKHEVVEDVQLAKSIRASGNTIRMYNGVDIVHCRMYTSGNEIWSGLRKNFMAGFNNNLIFFVLAAILHIVVYLLPVYTLIVGLVLQQLSIVVTGSIAILLILFQRILLSGMFKWSYMLIFYHFIAVVWFQLLGVQCIIDRVFKRKATWKGRAV